MQFKTLRDLKRNIEELIIRCGTDNIPILIATETESKVYVDKFESITIGDFFGQNNICLISDIDSKDLDNIMNNKPVYINQYGFGNIPKEDTENDS